MTTLKVRAATQEDIPAFTEYIRANQAKNEFDPEVLGYATTRVLAVDDIKTSVKNFDTPSGSEPVMFLPITLTIMLDSLAPKPSLPPHKRALALRKCVMEIIDRAAKHGIGEIHFLSTDPATIRFAKAHGFEELETKILRLKPRQFSPRKKVDVNKVV